MLHLLKLVFGALVRSFRARGDLLLENLALRQQLAVLSRNRPRPRFSNGDRFLWIMLRRFWSGWRKPLIVVQPDTVVRWLWSAKITQNGEIARCFGPNRTRVVNCGGTGLM